MNAKSCCSRVQEPGTERRQHETDKRNEDEASIFRDREVKKGEVCAASQILSPQLGIVDLLAYVLHIPRDGLSSRWML